ncbi:MAG TPA: hypothetical protein VL975_00030 [Candidatus Micrarchaeia archaeon]|nr:hypothetical protein [Candidatus Micrarchaeia archaeon]
MELTAEHAARLEQMHGRGFEIAAFPMYANYIGLRKGTCVALIEPGASGKFRLFGQPTMLIGENFSVRVRQEGREWFVWKQQRVEATSERLGELKAFAEELAQHLL